MRPKHLRRNFAFIHLTMNDCTKGFRTYMKSYKYSFDVYKHVGDGKPICINDYDGIRVFAFRVLCINILSKNQLMACNRNNDITFTYE